MEISKKEFLKIPQTPGVYTFWENNKPIYIGKSVNLKSRLNSYLLPNLGTKTKAMVTSAQNVTFVKVNSDLESLLLESYLIKKHKPKYNIVLKDDKHALYIVITREEFPRVLASRSQFTVHGLPLIYFGPFPNSTNVKMILKMIRKIFPFSDHKIGKKPCLYSHLGLCNPCPSEIVQSTQYTVLRNKYKNNIRNIKLVLSRKFNIVRNGLEKEMDRLSKVEKYEEAKIIRDQIKTLDYITQEKITVERFLENPNLTQDIRSQELESLLSLLTVHSTRFTSLRRIECFDVAHLQGMSATASMVVFIDGEKESSEYRHFKIKQAKRQSDYDSMREIAKRRISHLKSPTSPRLRETQWDKPNLIIVDGGLGQVRIFDEACKPHGIPVVGIAKHPDRLIFPNGTKVRLQGQTLQLVSRIRDEAHRFARRLHHKLVSKVLLT